MESLELHPTNFFYATLASLSRINTIMIYHNNTIQIDESLYNLQYHELTITTFLHIYYRAQPSLTKDVKLPTYSTTKHNFYLTVTTSKNKLLDVLTFSLIFAFIVPWVKEGTIGHNLAVSLNILRSRAENQ